MFWNKFQTSNVDVKVLEISYCVFKKLDGSSFGLTALEIDIDQTQTKVIEDNSDSIWKLRKNAYYSLIYCLYILRFDLIKIKFELIFEKK